MNPTGTAGVGKQSTARNGAGGMEEELVMRLLTLGGEVFTQVTLG